MRKKTAAYGLLFLFFALALNGCASSKKAKCSCPNFRGSRAIYGKVDSKNYQLPITNYKFKALEVEVDNAVDSQLTTYDF